MTSGHIPDDIIAAAEASRAKWDIPASVSLAQWALESAWGTRMPEGSNNPFGIKATGTQPSVATLTHEEAGGRLATVSARFRVFASIAEAFEAHAQLLATSSHYAQARLVRHDPDAFARALTGIYATDSRYGEKLIGLMRAWRLYDHDAVPPAAAPLPAPPLVSHPVAVAKPNWLDRLFAALTLKKAA